MLTTEGLSQVQTFHLLEGIGANTAIDVVPIAAIAVFTKTPKSLCSGVRDTPCCSALPFSLLAAGGSLCCVEARLTTRRHGLRYNFHVCKQPDTALQDVISSEVTRTCSDQSLIPLANTGAHSPAATSYGEFENLKAA